MKKHVVKNDLFGCESSFCLVYKTYFARCVRFASKYTGSREDAENIVQDVFLHIWENKNSITVTDSLNLWMFSLIRNRCIDFLRRKSVEDKGKQHIQEEYAIQFEAQLKSRELSDEDPVPEDEQLINAVYKSIENLPESCRRIFKMSKIEQKKYAQIAKELGITHQTVANQMSIALGKLRNELRNYRR